MKKMYLGIALIAALLMIGNAWAETITVVSYGGTYNKGLEETIGKPFTKATGIKVIFTTRPTYAQMAAQVKSGNITWDVVEAESRMHARAAKNGLLEKLDLSMINRDQFIKGAVTDYGVGIIYYSYLITYNTDKWPVGKGPKSMKDFWDVKKFPGPRTTKRTAESNLEAALLADGVPRDKIYPMDIDRALKKLKELKPHISVYYKSGGQTQQIMREKEADLGWVPGGRMIQLAAQGVPVAWEWNDQVIVLDYWTILKGNKKKDAAMKYIAFASDPKIQAAFAEWTNYLNVKRKSSKTLAARITQGVHCCYRHREPSGYELSIVVHL